MASETKNSGIPGLLRISRIVVYFLYFYVLVGIISLLFRVFLLLFSASPDAGFSQFVYRVSSDYLEPFRGIFPPKPVSDTGYLDVAALFAILVYLFVMWGIRSLIVYVESKIAAAKLAQASELAAQQEHAEHVEQPKAQQPSLAPQFNEPDPVPATRPPMGRGRPQSI